MKRLNITVLVSAYACEPGKGSEPGVGWNWVRQIARFADEVWVITRANNRKVIEEALAKEPLSNVHWVYFDLPRWARFWKKGQRGVHLYYYIWQIGIYFLARRLHQTVQFDLTHHVTFVNYWMPSFLSLLPVPFVWGPVGGGDSTPKAFYKTFTWRGKLYEILRMSSQWLGERDIFTRITAKRSILALATTKETAHKLSKLGAKNVHILSQVALSENEIIRLENFPFRQEPPLRLVSIGNLLHWKGFHLGIEAFAKFANTFPESEYWIMGNGPEKKNLEWLAYRLGVAERVKFLGRLPRESVLTKLAECDVLVHPSLHDSGGMVVAEAMAAGKPVICLDLGGPALQVTTETGFKIPAHTPEQVVEDITEAMLKLAQDTNLRRKMGKAARRRVKEKFNWAKRREEIARLYTQILGNSKTEAATNARK